VCRQISEATAIRIDNSPSQSAVNLAGVLTESAANLSESAAKLAKVRPNWPGKKESIKKKKTWLSLEGRERRAFGT
jgi:hypothetical protein